jgi:hypothetical protein
MKKVVFFFTLGCLCFCACKKKKEVVDDKPKEDIEMQRITKHPWEVYKLVVSGSDIWNTFLIKDCQKDDYYRFSKDSVLTQYENTNICAGGTDSVSSEWHFYEGRKKLIGTILGMTDTADVIMLEETEMQLGVTFQDNPTVIHFRKK